MEGGIPVTGVSEVVLEVADLAASEAFYAEVLGLPVVERWEERRAVWVMAGERTRIGLWLGPPGGPAAAAAPTCPSRCTSPKPTTTPRWPACASAASPSRRSPSARPTAAPYTSTTRTETSSSSGPGTSPGTSTRSIAGPMAAPGRTAADLAESLRAGDKRALARAITLAENDDPEGWAL